MDTGLRQRRRDLCSWVRGCSCGTSRDDRGSGENVDDRSPAPRPRRTRAGRSRQRGRRLGVFSDLRPWRARHPAPARRARPSRAGNISPHRLGHRRRRGRPAAFRATRCRPDRAGLFAAGDRLQPRSLGAELDRRDQRGYPDPRQLRPRPRPTARRGSRRSFARITAASPRRSTGARPWAGPPCW